MDLDANWTRAGKELLGLPINHETFNCFDIEPFFSVTRLDFEIFQ